MYRGRLDPLALLLPVVPEAAAAQAGDPGDLARVRETIRALQVRSELKQNRYELGVAVLMSVNGGAHPPDGPC